MRESGAQIACRWGWGGDFCTMRSKKKIGNTTFIVNSFFPQKGNQTIASKLENLIKADVQKETVT